MSIRNMYNDSVLPEDALNELSNRQPIVEQPTPRPTIDEILAIANKASRVGEIPREYGSYSDRGKLFDYLTAKRQGIEPEQAGLERSEKNATIAALIGQGMGAVGDVLSRTPGKSAPFHMNILDRIQSPLKNYLSTKLAQRTGSIGEDKEAIRQREHYIPGFKYKSKGILNDKIISDMRQKKSAVGSVANNIDKYKKETEGNFKAGLTLLDPEMKSSYESFANAIKLQLKNVLGLGVLQPADLKLLDTVIPSASSFSRAFMTKEGSLGRLLEQIKNTYIKTVIDEAKELGWEVDDWELGKIGETSPELENVIQKIKENNSSTQQTNLQSNPIVPIKNMSSASDEELELRKQELLKKTKSKTVR